MPGATQFPTGLDAFPEIGPNTDEAAAGVEHDVVHANVHAALVALQTRVGIADSADAGSLDAQMAAAVSRLDGLDADVDLLADAQLAHLADPTAHTTDQIAEGLALFFTGPRANEAIAAAFAAGTHTNLIVEFDPVLQSFTFTASGSGGSGSGDIRDTWLMG